MSITLSPLHPTIGVEICGCDLSKPLSDEHFQAMLDELDGPHPRATIQRRGAGGKVWVRR